MIDGLSIQSQYLWVMDRVHNLCELRVKNKVLENQKDDGSGKFAINMG